MVGKGYGPSGNGHGRWNGSRASTTRAVVLAGGRGTRLAPYTSVLPKPLMPVGDRSILELVIDQLQAHGIEEVTLCLGYLSHLIEAVCDARPSDSVRIDYVREQQALGTAGPLRLVEAPNHTFVVLNGDVLTNLDYRDLVSRHRESGCALTVATHDRPTKIPYGVLRLDESRITGIEEKPEIVSVISMGIYAVEPSVIEYVPRDRPFDFPDLVRVLLEAGQPVGAYRHDGLWFDIGRKEDYEQALEIWLGHVNGNGHAIGIGHVNGNSNGFVPAAARTVALDAFRETLSRVPTAVTIVTTVKESRPHGTTVSAFSSLSAEPPLVMVALDRSSDLLQLLQEVGRFAVNLLAAGQEEYGRLCARKGPEKFAGVPWREEGGLPRLEGAAAFLSCEVEQVVPGGDHLIVIGRVTACDTDELQPLVYHRRRFLELTS